MFLWQKVMNLEHVASIVCHFQVLKISHVATRESASHICSITIKGLVKLQLELHRIPYKA
jgi:hypothetical protein